MPLERARPALGRRVRRAGGRTGYYLLYTQLDEMYRNVSNKAGNNGRNRVSKKIIGQTQGR